jgi:membrane protein
MLKITYSEWSADKVPRMGAALAYYTIFSLAPLLIIAIAIAGLAFGEKAAQGAIIGEIQGLVGPDSAKAIQTMIEAAHKPTAGVLASLLGVIVLLVGASGVFAELQDALNTIWEVKPNPKGGLWEFVKSRFLSFGMVLGIGFLLLVSLLLSVALSGVSKLLGGLLPVPIFLLHSLDLAISFAVITTLFAMIFKVLPQAMIEWRAVLVGAGMTSLLLTVGKFVIGLYVGKSLSASTYGAAGSLVLVVAWLYYSAQILYFGAEFTRVYANENGTQIVPKPGAEKAPKLRQAARL